MRRRCQECRGIYVTASWSSRTCGVCLGKIVREAFDRVRLGVEPCGHAFPCYSDLCNQPHLDEYGCVAT